LGGLRRTSHATTIAPTAAVASSSTNASVWSRSSPAAPARHATITVPAQSFLRMHTSVGPRAAAIRWRPVLLAAPLPRTR
jgi:hypothetical protein